MKTQALTNEMSQDELAIRLEERAFELAQRKAAVYAKSTLVPDTYRDNIGNVLIATNMAKRLNADILMTMQNLYIVHGKPAWSSAFLIASFNNCGRFSSMRFAFTPGKPGTDDYGCRAYATELSSGEMLEGTLITIGMAKREGWYEKNGSKWKTMPEQMLRYRAAAFFVRTTAPEISMGLMSSDEVEDTHDSRVASGSSRVTIADLTAKLAAPLPTPPPPPADDLPDTSYEPPPSDEEKIFQEYLEAVACMTKSGDPTRLYDSMFGPDSIREFSPQQNEIAAKAANDREQELLPKRGPRAKQS